MQLEELVSEEEKEEKDKGENILNLLEELLWKKSMSGASRCSALQLYDISVMLCPNHSSTKCKTIVLC